MDTATNNPHAAPPSIKIFPRQRRTKPDRALQRLKLALLKLAGTGNRRDFLTVKAAFALIPELKNV